MRRTSTWFGMAAVMFTAALIILMLLCSALFRTYFAAFRPSIGAASASHSSALQTAPSPARQGSGDATGGWPVPGGSLSPGEPAAPVAAAPTTSTASGGKGGATAAPAADTSFAALAPGASTTGTPAVQPGLPGTVTVPGTDLTGGGKQLLQTSGSTIILN